jgi:hypothetical protein
MKSQPIIALLCTRVLPLCLAACVLVLDPASCLADDEYVFDCGVLRTEPGGSCLLFTARDGRQVLLSNYAGFAAGDTIFVKGLVGGACSESCQGTYPCIDCIAVDRCWKRDLGCGLLYDDEECPPFFYTEACCDRYWLDTWGPFTSGDSVRVVGWVYPQQFLGSCWPYLEAFVDDVASCQVPTPARHPSWGALKAIFR